MVYLFLKFSSFIFFFGNDPLWGNLESNKIIDPFFVFTLFAEATLLGSNAVAWDAHWVNVFLGFPNVIRRVSVDTCVWIYV